MNEYKIRTDNFTPLQWGIIVESIAEGYFYEHEYTPHFGILNAMRIFFNECVEEVNGEKPEKSDNLDDIDRFVTDPEFIAEFNKGIYPDTNEFVIDMTFENAYQTAMAIVEQRTTSWGELTHIISDVMQRVSEYAQNLASEDNINLLQTLSKSLTDGEITADDIVEAYGKTLKKNASE